MDCPFHGEIDVADATVLTKFTLYLGAEVAPYVLGANDMVEITDYSISPEVAGVVVGCGNTNAAGTRWFDRWCAAAGGADRALKTPHYLPAGHTPSLVGTVADHLKATIHGLIHQRSM
jgi:hypothetical protein